MFGLTFLFCSFTSCRGERRVIAPPDRSFCAELAGAIDLALAESTNDLLASFSDLGLRCRSHDQAQKNDDALNDYIRFFMFWGGQAAPTVNRIRR